MEQLRATAEQFETERQTTNGLRESLRESGGREALLVEELEAKEEAMRWQREEVERQREAMELQHYCPLDAVREKWEAREQRVIDELE